VPRLASRAMGCSAVMPINQGFWRQADASDPYTPYTGHNRHNERYRAKFFNKTGPYHKSWPAVLDILGFGSLLAAEVYSQIELCHRVVCRPICTGFPASMKAPTESHSLPRRGLSRLDAAVYVGVSPSKFDQLVDDGRMPGPRRIDGRKVWDVRELDLCFDDLRADGPTLAGNSWDDR
jgi:hypothetical protein